MARRVCRSIGVIRCCRSWGIASDGMGEWVDGWMGHGNGLWDM